MKKTFYLLAYLLLFSTNVIAAPRECVILLHGLARSHYGMTSLATLLERYHYVVINHGYPSTRKSIKELANQYIQPMIDECLSYNATHINFVTHSLGGIILQQYLQDHKIENLENIIMMAPPNHGSPLADLLRNNWLYRIIAGPAGQELTTYKFSTPNQLHLEPRYQVGVIAGTFRIIPLVDYVFKEPNDGIVAVSSAKTDIMKDFLVLPVSHTFMMRNAMVEQQVLYFLRNGQFQHGVTSPLVGEVAA